MSHIESSRLLTGDVGEERQQFEKSCSDFKRMLKWFRVVNDRKVSPEIMRRHIDFIRHETQNNYTVVIIDSLHKLYDLLDAFIKRSQALIPKAGRL